MARNNRGKLVTDWHPIQGNRNTLIYANENGNRHIPYGQLDLNNNFTFINICLQEAFSTGLLWL